MRALAAFKTATSCGLACAIGRPSRTPLLRARSNPAFTRSRMMSRSSWAIAPMIVNMAWPIGVEVSNCSCKEMKLILSERNCSKAVRRCFTERAKRSNRQTSTAWNLPCPGCFYQAVQRWSLLFRSRIAVVHELFDNGPSTIRRMGSQGLELHLGVLSIGADSGVQHYLHRPVLLRPARSVIAAQNPSRTFLAHSNIVIADVETSSLQRWSCMRGQPSQPFDHSFPAPFQFGYFEVCKYVLQVIARRLIDHLFARAMGTDNCLIGNESRSRSRQSRTGS